MSRRGRHGRKRQQEGGSPDTRRDRRSTDDPTPREFYAQAGGGPIREPFYLWELGLTRDPYVERVPRNQGGPIIRTR